MELLFLKLTHLIQDFKSLGYNTSFGDVSIGSVTPPHQANDSSVITADAKQSILYHTFTVMMIKHH